MKLVIVGATGGTGQSLMEEALSAGHDVFALVRNPDKITMKNEKLTVVKTDLYDSAKLVEHIRGCDAVLSSVGGRPGLFAPCDVYTGIGKASISAMREVGVKRHISVTAWGTKDDPNLPFIWRWLLKPSIMRNVVKDMADWEDYLMSECSDINYTVVRPPRLLSTPSEGDKLQVSEGQTVVDYKINGVRRQDLARFILECLTTEEYDQKMIAVTTLPKE